MLYLLIYYCEILVVDVFLCVCTYVSSVISIHVYLHCSQIAQVIELGNIKTHSSVSCGPRSRRATPGVYLQEESKCDFHTFIAP